MFMFMDAMYWNGGIVEYQLHAKKRLCNSSKANNSTLHPINGSVGNTAEF